MNISVKTGLCAGQSDAVIILNGTSNCSWCTKQREYFDSMGISYEFKDCDKGECRSGIESYPTLDNVVGYHKL
ncbi:MAG: hypothetical protein GY749_28105 [Desulfobacteraceae bacterium]|nr:hypothetical protein [Desulfobacteraceae bacterium]